MFTAMALLCLVTEGKELPFPALYMLRSEEVFPCASRV